MNAKRPAGSYFPKKLAYTLSVGALAAAIVGSWTPIVQLLTLLTTWDPTGHPLLLVAGLLVCTVLICYKQLAYAYLPWGSKGAIFSRSILHFTPLERLQDWGLALLGISLFLAAAYAASFWLLIFFLYCALGWWRCRVTLDRPRYARSWVEGRTHAENPILQWTSPLEFVESLDLASLNVALPIQPLGDRERQWCERADSPLGKMWWSLRAVHQNRGERAVPVTEALGTWFFGFRFHAGMALMLWLAQWIVWFRWQYSIVLAVAILSGAVLLIASFVGLSRMRRDAWGQLGEHLIRW